MQSKVAIRELRPLEDGDSRERSFSKLLAEVIQTASGGGKRADLAAIQTELLRRNWHP